MQHGLSSLPQPKNDYEIVVPENEMEVGEVTQNADYVEDQAELDARREAELAEQRKYRQ